MNMVQYQKRILFTLQSNYLTSMIYRSGKTILSRLQLAAVTLLLSISGLIPCAAQTGSNDHMFPSATGAKPFMDFDSKGFIINGKRTFLVSAGMEYARVPRALWHDRLLRLKRAGFNCIEVYTFWNFHEPENGKFDFSGDHDLDYFLKLVNQMGMYAIPRAGPYYCAEWDNGGYPVWLRNIPGLRVREDDPVFEKYVDRFFDTLIPIVAKNQINHGGSVVLVQLENEHNDAWGTYMPNGYFKHLQQKAVEDGLQVPYFFSGLHHSSDPAGDSKLLDDPARPNPWFSTEFWSVWYNYYSSTAKDAQTFERRTMKIIAHGGNGYNYYMAHGGTNFGYTNNDEDAASYDYGAAVGQAGDLRPVYYAFKRCALFARSMQEILENSADATATYHSMLKDEKTRITARHSTAGDIVFLDNPTHTTQQAQLIKEDGSRLPAQGALTLEAGDIFPIVHNYAVNNAVTLQWAPVKILGIQPQGNTTTIVVYGQPGTPAELYFSVNGSATAEGGTALTVNGSKVTLQATFTADNKPAEYAFTTGAKKIRILAVNTAAADRTWFLEDEGKQYIITGPSYAGNLKKVNGNFTLETEKYWHDSVEMPAMIFGDGFSKALSKKSIESVKITALSLTPWQAKNASEQAAAGYDDSKWKTGVNPPQMGADGDAGADAWYRTTINIDSTGIYTLRAGGGDRATVFVDNVVAGTGDIHKGEIALNLQKGKHTLAVFTAHDGRFKFYSFTGRMDSVESKGLFGEVLLRKGPPSINTLTGWRFLKAGKKDDVSQGPPPPDAGGWASYTIGKDAFHQREGFGWFQTIIPAPAAGINQLLLNFKSVDENAVVFINGKQLARHDGWNKPFAVTMSGVDTITKPIVLTLFIENYSNEGGIDQPVFCDNVQSSMHITGWHMKGGPGNPEATTGWKPLNDVAPEGRPYFFRTQFTAPAYNGARHPIWRVVSKGLGHGSVWVNGHNLGRYPEKIPINGLYIPECWLKAGVNDLVIYDEDGKSPSAVTVEAEMAASRDEVLMTFFTLN